MPELHIGVDEVGTGALCGPVLVCGVVPRFPFPDFKDSKQYTEGARDDAYLEVLSSVADYEIRWADNKAVDDNGIRNVWHDLVAQVIAALRDRNGWMPAVVDGNVLPWHTVGVTALVKGDQLDPVIAAASILAKVTRDELMRQLDEFYPDYGLAKCKGYGSAEHRAALRRIGPCPVHRNSFISKILRSSATIPVHVEPEGDEPEVVEPEAFKVEPVVLFTEKVVVPRFNPPAPGSAPPAPQMSLVEPVTVLTEDPVAPDSYAVIDFETADKGKDSACSVGVCRVQDGKIVERVYRLIRPPREYFEFTYVHGITWVDVMDQPDFKGIWNDIRPLLEHSKFIVAHSAPFDKAVLRACCLAAGVDIPVKPFLCTVTLARVVWPGAENHKLDGLCRQLGIPLEHHNAMSDAEACAELFLRAKKASPKSVENMISRIAFSL